ncbi:Glutamate synthase [NADPH] small chain [Candidatus Steffania adelgidicola]|nr:Glutamate synthase [NADPH] small chain [Candidatus Steffania adelgidicola]
MPGSPRREVRKSREEGVEFIFNLQSLSLEMNDSSQVIGVKMIHIIMDEPDTHHGRCRLENIACSEHILDADVQWCFLSDFARIA